MSTFPRPSAVERRSAVAGSLLPASRDLFDAGPANVPLLRDDETLYSWCAAVHLLNGSVSATRTSQRLFGVKFAALAHDIPSHLDQMHPDIAAMLPDSQLLVRRNSLLGFYLPWLDEDTVEVANRHVATGIPKDVKMHLGLPASRVGALHLLKGCPACIDEDITSHGRAYWHVNHQYPSVWVCTEHLLPLRQLQLRKSPRHLREWLLPTNEKRTGWKAITVTNTYPLQRLAEMSGWLPTLMPASFAPVRLSRTYQAALKRAGFVTAKGNLRLAKLTRAFLSHYQGLRDIPGFHVLDSVGDELGGFVGNVARRQAKRAHPFKHLLVINWLFDSFDDFLATYRGADASSCAEEVDNQIITSDSRETIFVSLVTERGLSLSAAGREVGVTPTTAVRWAKLNGISYVRRTKKMTSEVAGRCRALLMAGASKTKIADEMGISSTTITRLLSSDAALQKAWHQAKFVRRRRRNRARFLAVLRDNPGVPVKTLRLIPGNGYMWLYRNDREWLIEHLPMLK